MLKHKPGVEEAASEDHDGLAGGLLQLQLDVVELLPDDGDHPLDLLLADRPCPRLLLQQVHHVTGELVARLQHKLLRTNWCGKVQFKLSSQVRNF